MRIGRALPGALAWVMVAVAVAPTVSAELPTQGDYGIRVDGPIYDLAYPIIKEVEGAKNHTLEELLKSIINGYICLNFGWWDGDGSPFKITPGGVIIYVPIDPEGIITGRGTDVAEVEINREGHAECDVIG